MRETQRERRQVPGQKDVRALFSYLTWNVLNLGTSELRVFILGLSRKTPRTTSSLLVTMTLLRNEKPSLHVTPSHSCPLEPTGQMWPHCLSTSVTTSFSVLFHSVPLWLVCSEG